MTDLVTRADPSLTLVERAWPERDCAAGELQFAQDLVVGLLFKNCKLSTRDEVARRISCRALLVAYRAEAPCGVATYQTGLRHDEETFAYTSLDYLATAPEVKGTGVGRRLVEAVRIRALEAHDRQIRLIQATGSVGFYDRLGFESFDRSPLRILRLSPTTPQQVLPTE